MGSILAALFPSLSLLSTELSYAKAHLCTADGLKQQARLNPSKSQARAFFATLSTSRPNPALASTAALMPLVHRGFPGSRAEPARALLVAGARLAMRFGKVLRSPEKLS